MNRIRTTCAALVAGALLAISVNASTALAGPEEGDGHGHAADIGMPGDPSEAVRTVEIIMYDNYFEPESIAVADGETVRFAIRNEGAFVHEFNIATAAMHAAHAPQMMMMMEHGVLEPDRVNWDIAEMMQGSMGHGMHEEPNSLLLEPGKSGEITWTFGKADNLEFACNIPGHYDSGMTGPIKFENR